MRSSVSAILSDPVPDTTMSFPDYRQASSDHASLLVLCQSIGHQLEQAQFRRAMDVVASVKEVKVNYSESLTSWNRSCLTDHLGC